MRAKNTYDLRWGKKGEVVVLIKAPILTGLESIRAVKGNTQGVGVGL